MAIQILPPKGGLSQTIGTGLGSGIGQLLQGLAEGKAQQMQSQQGLQALQQLGLSPESAQGISQLSIINPELGKMALQQALEAPQNAAFAQALGLVSGQEPQESNLAGTPSASGDSATPFVPMGLKPEQAFKIAELAQKGKKEEAAAGREILKLNKDEIKEIRSKSKAAKDQLRDLERLKKLGDTGNLDSATYDAFLKNSGFDIAALRSPDSQEYNKIVNNFVKNIKDVFGARISNFELERFMETLPSLSQSPEGRKRVIANMERFARLNEAYGKQLNKLMRQNKGMLPADFMVKIDDAIDKKAEKFAKQFEKDLAKKVPEAESALSVAGGAVAGRSIPALGGAATGAALGSVFPGVGTATGALLGGLTGSVSPSLIRALRGLG